LKIKCLQSQEFVIGGFTEPSGSRVGLGALLLGVHDDHAKLRYAGCVGTGFSSQTLKDLRARLVPLKRKSPAFTNPPTGRDARGVHWIEPALVGEVAFTGWTRDGLLRHPSFKGLREDKPAVEIKREVAAPAVGDAGGSDAIAGITLTHPDRVLYPEQNITKRELALYYEAIANWIMPHLEDRLLTLVRCPEGRRKQCFYQRHAHDGLHESVRRIPVREAGAAKSYVGVDSITGLIALVQMGVLELHTWGSRTPRLEQPDRLIFDLDPDPALPWERLRQAALALRARLSELGLSSFVKTTGGKGLHVVAPITPKQNWEWIKEFSRLVARSIVREDPARYTATMSKAKRTGKIFIDYLRNARAATAVCAYSTRAQPGAPVSVPLRWEELTADVRSDHFTVRDVPWRLARLRSDPWQDYESARRPLTRALMKKL
jgi:bifunctional non-homologous end joining protein LigD